MLAAGVFSTSGPWLCTTARRTSPLAELASISSLLEQENQRGVGNWLSEPRVVTQKQRKGRGQARYFQDSPIQNHDQQTISIDALSMRC